MEDLSIQENQQCAPAYPALPDPYETLNLDGFSQFVTSMTADDI
jgi:hypothetical protein